MMMKIFGAKNLSHSVRTRVEVATATLFYIQQGFIKR